MNGARSLDGVPLHGGQLAEIAERFGVARNALLDFSANINPEGPPDSVLPALRDALEDESVLSSYPDLRETELKRAIAESAGVAASRISVANGFVPLLEAALRTLPIQSCLLPVPAFVEYEKTMARSRVAVTRCALRAEADFSYDWNAMLGGGGDAILLANPQNPSGVLCSRERMMDLVATAAERNVFVLLDEAFIDFAPEATLSDCVDRFANLIVFRSVTKFYGVPGLRVAYALANERLTAKIDAELAPWPITTLAARGVCAALGNAAYGPRTRALNAERRDWLRAQMQSMGFRTYPSAANFVLFRLPTAVEPQNFWQRMIVEHGIVLRWCANYDGLADGHFRAAVRTDEDNSRLLDALACELRPFKADHGELSSVAPVCSRTVEHSSAVSRRTFGLGLISLAMASRLRAQARPQRIISTAPSITEALFALGLGPLVVGVSQFCEYPPEVRRLPKVGSYLKPDAEAIARLRPDLVILERTSSELLNRLGALQIAFLEVPHETLGDVFTGIELIAKAAGVAERGDALVAKIRGSLDATRAKARALPSPRVIVVVDRSPGLLANIIGAGPNNYVNEILEIAGGTNVLAKHGLPEYPRIALETVLRENPDVILDVSATQESEADEQAARVAALALWRQHPELAAVRSGRVRIGTSNVLVVPGPRSGEAAEKVFEFIHSMGAQS